MNTMDKLERRMIDAEYSLAAARVAIRSVFDMLENGHMEAVHNTTDDGDECPQDDTCDCLVRRLLLELQVAGGIDADSGRAILRDLPSRGPHDRADCPCGHQLGTHGVCGGCNCADEAP